MDTRAAEFPRAEPRPAEEMGTGAAVRRVAVGQVVLYALEADTAPSVGAGRVTSAGGTLALHSEAVRLGEYGTVRELAESELYRWAAAGRFDTLRYTRPVRVGERRYAVRLRLENARVGMEQLVVFTGAGAGLARVDRLWRALRGIRDDAAAAVMQTAAAFLLSDQTL